MKIEEFGKSNLEFDEKAPFKSEIDIDELNRFLKNGDVLIFYGGEPLLEIEKIKKIIDKIKNKVKYRIQTNGMLLHEIDSSYLNKIGKLLVSIDGNKERTDFNRGEETYDKIIENINLARKKDYAGEIVARMTISDSLDFYKQVLHLTGLIDKGLFNSIHWQLDAGFFKSDFNEKKFSRFVEEYNKQVSKLINWWIDRLKERKFYLLYPFVGITNSLLNNKKTKMRCGAGHSGFAITTNGMISACPVTNGVKTFYVGSIKKQKINEMGIKGSCLKCGYLDLCGGRCLYQNYSEFWPEKGRALICKTVRHLIDELREKIPKIKEMINKGIIRKDDFEYEKYFGPEIIP